jgi:acyl dehydratase
VSEFDPLGHRLAAARYFEDFRVGERFNLPSRTMTEALFAAFQLASGDNHPIHYDVEYCRAKGHPGLLAHGFQVANQTCAGAGPLAHQMGEALLGFLEQSARFLRPVHAGDTLYPSLTLTEAKPQRTTGVLGFASLVVNQRGETVLEGEHRYLLRKRSPG